MSYATYDFSESVDRAPISRSDIERVVSAWGQGNENTGSNKWHEEGGGTEWSGGFLLMLKDGTYGYLTGWCDYTGWGCQDGIEFHRFSERPTHADLLAKHEAWSQPPDESEWDIEPADLNRWLQTAEAQRP